MKISFDINDEKTVTNTTVKLTAWISGQVGEDDRSKLEKRARDVVEKFMPNRGSDGTLKWAYSDFSYINNGMMFRVQATTRIDSSLNDQLEEKAKLASDRQTEIRITDLDASIPMHELRAAESDLRVKLILLAQAEAKKLGGSIAKISFGHPGRVPSSAATYASMVSNSGKAAGYEGTELGHSEKISLKASVVVSSKNKIVAEPKVVRA